MNKLLDNFDFEKFNTSIDITFLKKNYTIDKKYLIYLVSRSTVFSKREKVNILFYRIPKLNQKVLKELISTLENERLHLSMLIIKNPNEINFLSKIKYQRMKEWLLIEDEYIRNKGYFDELSNIDSYSEKNTKKKRFYGFDFYSKPYDISQIINASKEETQYFFGGIIRAKDGFLQQISYLDEIPVNIILKPSYYHFHEKDFEESLKKYGLNINQISYFNNKKLGEILTELNIKYNNPKDRFERAKILLNLKKQGFISKFLNYLLFS
ncbi:MAG: hypothetical protein U0354_15595 [Candidatus Sericytochromatia bacterium]